MLFRESTSKYQCVIKNMTERTTTDEISTLVDQFLLFIYFSILFHIFPCITTNTNLINSK